MSTKYCAAQCTSYTGEVLEFHVEDNVIVYPYDDVQPFDGFTVSTVSNGVVTDTQDFDYSYNATDVVDDIASAYLIP